ncbi:MAG: hypothetical protein JWO09_543 [Bacteroidetes bacterium]|nr:hypothetical protein [Bacteroidota bacterium]
MKRIAAILFFISALTGLSLAQKFTVAVSKNKVAVGEPFQIQFTLSGPGSDMKLPNLNDFEVYQGPFQSSSATLSSSGVYTQSASIAYVIGAKKEGKFVIGPASVNVNGATVQSNAIIIEVSKGAGTAAASSADLMVRAIVNKSKAYIGEEVAVTFKLYFRVDILGMNAISMPSFDGFFLQEAKNNPNRVTETVNGVPYDVTELKRTFAIPQRTGRLSIDPLEVECIVRRSTYGTAAVKIKSNPLSIEVLPLPEAGKPPGFAGAVGDYNYKVELSGDKVKANEALNLLITISGKGNLKLVEAPKIGFPEDFEAYDPKVKENISVGAGMSGSKTFDYLVIPRHEGDYKINNLDFSFFNPSKNEYVTIPAPELNIHVDKGEGNSNTSANVYSPANKTEVRELGTDIRYIKTQGPELRDKNDYFFGSGAFWTGLISPFLLFFIFLFYRRRSIEQNKDAVAVKSRQATKMAKKRLSAAEEHLRSLNRELFYLEISQALYGYLSDKLNISGSSLNKGTIAEMLAARSVSGTTIAQLISTLDNCEFARYAPSAVSGDLNLIYTSTVELITKIENEIK